MDHLRLQTIQTVNEMTPVLCATTVLLTNEFASELKVRIERRVTKMGHEFRALLRLLEKGLLVV